MPSSPPPASDLSLSFLRRATSGWAGGLFGGVLASLVLALATSGEGQPWAAAAGLLLPFVLPLSVLLSSWVALVHPGSRLPELGKLLSSKRTRVRTALSGPAIVFVWVLIGQLTVRLLGAFPDRPAAGGVLTAASALGVLTAGAWGVDRGATLLLKFAPAPPRRVAAGIAIGFPLLAVAALIMGGNTSGTGSPLALFGVFRRPELDLSPLFHLLFLTTVVYGSAHVARRGNRALVLAALGAALSGSAWTMHAAWKLDFREAVSIERARGLPALSLSSLRRAIDSDGDGFSRAFGGGDCDDSNAAIHPGARDVPDNGLDEDCRGGDRKKPSVAQEVKEKKAHKHELPEGAHVLLLTIDTLRWDLGFSGAKSRPRLSPHLDALAERSTVFERAYSLASYTSKSLGPMLLGRYPSETKRTFEHFDRFSRDVPFIQERLQEAGIHTTSVQGYWYFFFKSYGFERGWDELDSTAAPKAVAIEGDKTSNGDEVADRTIHHLERLAESGKRFFVWSHWVDPHSEYVPHEEFDFGAESRERYDGEVAFVDAQLGRIFKALERLKLDEKTIVIITSDHGEAFGEHGMIRHGFEVWEELVRVPLLIRVPGAPPRRVAPRRSLIDIAPTILQAFGVEGASGEGEFIRGSSLLRDVLSTQDEELDVRPVLVDMPEGPHNRQRQAFYEGDHKLITSSGRVLGLFDLEADPGEKKDLSSDEALVSSMEAKMNAFLDTLQPIEPSR